MGKAVGAPPASAAKRTSSPLPRIRAAKASRSGKLSTTVAPPVAGMQLHTVDGSRQYLTASERDGFLREAKRGDCQVRTLLAYAGCRLSEALALTADRVDLAAGVLVFESLKKRRSGIYRAVPVPLALGSGLVMACQRDDQDYVGGGQIKRWLSRVGRGASGRQRL